jgi:hypothetical protein
VVDYIDRSLWVRRSCCSDQRPGGHPSAAGTAAAAGPTGRVGG